MAKTIAAATTPTETRGTEQLLSYEELLQASAGAESSGQPVTMGQASGLLPNFGDRTALFFLASSPKSWELCEVDGEPILLPILSPVIVLPGVNGTRAGRNGMPPNPADVAARVGARGSRVLTDQLPEYLRAHKGRNGTTGYFLAWERVSLYDDGKYVVDVDRKARDAYRLSLLRRGIIPPPRADIARRLLRAAEASVRRQANLPRRDDDGEMMQQKRARVAALRRLVQQGRTPTEVDDG